MSTFRKIKVIVNNNRRKYNEKNVRLFIRKYRKDKNNRKHYFNRILKYSYAIILGCVFKFERRNGLHYDFTKSSEYFNESVIILQRCIEKFDLERKKIKFSAYLWDSLIKRFVRFKEIYGSQLKYVEEGNCIVYLDETGREGDTNRYYKQNTQEVYSEDKDKRGVKQLKKDLMMILKTELSETEYKVFLLKATGRSNVDIMKEAKVSRRVLNQIFLKIRIKIKENF